MIYNERAFLCALASLVVFPFDFLPLDPLPLFSLFGDFLCFELTLNWHALYPQSFSVVDPFTE